VTTEESEQPVTLRERLLVGLTCFCRIDNGGSVRTIVLTGVCAAVLVTAACSAGGPTPEPPGLAARDTTMTTVKPAHQDLNNQVSLPQSEDPAG
jgi:hypothetical protein